MVLQPFLCDMVGAFLRTHAHLPGRMGTVGEHRLLLAGEKHGGMCTEGMSSVSQGMNSGGKWVRMFENGCRKKSLFLLNFYSYFHNRSRDAFSQIKSSCSCRSIIVRDFFLAGHVSLGQRHSAR